MRNLVKKKKRDVMHIYMSCIYCRVERAYTGGNPNVKSYPRETQVRNI